MTSQHRLRVFVPGLIAFLLPVILYSAESLYTYQIPLNQGAVYTAVETIQLTPGQQIYPLQHSWIDSVYRTVNADGSLLDTTEYVVDRVGGLFTLKKPVSENRSISITYHYLPIKIPFTFQRSSEPKLLQILLRDSIKTEMQTAEGRKSGAGRAESYTGTTNLMSHGSIFRELNLSTGRGLALNSGLRMELDGTIGENIGVTAALTDQNTPLQPEGTSQTLEELDKVFINLNHPNGEATFGDFSTNLQVGQFGQFARKLEGVTISGNYRDQEATAVGATSRGKFRTQRFSGIEGNQGPYRLAGADGSTDIVILAGTERIWLDGERLTRGATEDYTIDYSLAELTFTPRRMITAESRIVVDFQYADFQYSRSIYAGTVTSHLWNNRLQISGLYASETDDKDTPLNPVINGSVRDSLSHARAFTNFIRVPAVTRDSSGSYIRVDSARIRIFRYVGDGKGDYTLFFSRDPNGAYVRRVDAASQFFYEYDPTSTQIKYSPTVSVTPPRSHQIQSFSLRFEPGRRFRLHSDIAASQVDVNTYADNPATRQSGIAGTVDGDLKLLDWGDANSSDGIDIYGGYQNWNAHFSPLDRVEAVEFNRRWNLSPAAPAREESGEDQTQIGLKIQRSRHLQANLEWGMLNRGADFSATRQLQSILARYGLIEQAQLYREHATSADVNSRELQKARVQVGQDWLHSFAAWRYEEFTGDSSVVLEQPEIGFLLTGKRGSRITLSYSPETVNQRPDSLTHRIQKSSSETYTLSGALNRGRSLSSRWNIVHRIRDYSSYFEEHAGLTDNKFTLAEWTGAWRRRDRKITEISLSWDTQWRREQVAKQEYRYLQVEPGLGEYSYDSTFADYYPDPDGDYILRIVPSGDYEEVTGVQLGGELNLEPGSQIRNSKNKIINTVLGDLRSVTRWRYEEKSRRRTPRFDFGWQSITSPDLAIVRHLQTLQEDLHLFQTSAYAAFQYRFYRSANVNGLDARGTEIESTQEHSLRWRATAYFPWTIEATADWRQYRRRSLFQNLRNRDLTRITFSGNFGYHPSQPHIFRTTVDLERHHGTIANQVAKIRLWGLGEEYTYQISEKGRFTAQLRWSKVSSAGDSEFRYLPFEVTQGSQPGDNFEWTVRADYKINDFLTFRLNYRGRDEPNRRIYHQGSGEFRAVF